MWGCEVVPENIAIKSSQKDELKEIDDTGGLMAGNCQIRCIITKQALQEDGIAASRRKLRFLFPAPWQRTAHGEPQGIPDRRSRRSGHVDGVRHRSRNPD
jgi:hypothetical protein